MYGCPSCGYEGMLHRHGHYDRNVVTLYQHFVISIQRFQCPSCKKTYSLLPSMLIPYFVYSFDFVIFCLYCIFSLSEKASDVCRFLGDCNKQCFITASLPSLILFTMILICQCFQQMRLLLYFFPKYCVLTASVPSIMNFLKGCQNIFSLHRLSYLFRAFLCPFSDF
ncbi:DUF6431 domain-containing protein [Thermotalea metallivorans]|uniref:DUF6431 domain-containing protein n=1 Tax=Thermotalea metallivorans TaxID=520762 RepID=UPI0038CD6C7B